MENIKKIEIKVLEEELRNSRLESTIIDEQMIIVAEDEVKSKNFHHHKGIVGEEDKVQNDKSEKCAKEKCIICNKEKNKNDLSEKHLFYCSKCPKQYKYKKNKGVKPNCPVCAKRVTTYKGLL